MENNITNTTPADETASTTPSTPEETAAAVTTEEITTGEPVTNQAPTAQTDSTVATDAPDTPVKKPYVVEETFPSLRISALIEPDDPADAFAPTADPEPSVDPEFDVEPEFVIDPEFAADPEPVAASTIVPSLPDGYLANGYHAVSEKGHKYLRPEFVGDYAELIARNLSPMKAADFNALMREMKRSKKNTLPFEARLTAAAEMLPKALALVHRKKAPALLVSFIKDNLDHIQNDDDWTYFYRHASAVGSFLVAMEGGVS